MKYFLLLSLFIGHFAVAALLPTKFVFERVVEQNPKQNFVLEQEISFGDLEPLILKETWQVHSPDLMRLTVVDTRNQKVILSVLYRNKKRLTNLDGQLQTQELPKEFLQKLFFIPTASEFAQQATKWGVIPNNALANPPPAVRSSQITYKEEPFVRLARSQGTITYAYGPISLSAEEKYPGLWVEQDLFQIKKIRFPSKATLTVGEYSNIAPKVFFPKTWSFQWDSKSVKMKLKNTSFKNIDSSKLQSTPLELSRFTDISQPELKEQVEEFYSRFY